MRITENFSLSEFDCKDGSELPTALLPNVLDLADNLQVLRDYLGVPISINSAYRSLEYNRKIGGATNSQHHKSSYLRRQDEARRDWGLQYIHTLRY